MPHYSELNLTQVEDMTNSIIELMGEVTLTGWNTAFWRRSKGESSSIPWDEQLKILWKA